MAISRNGRWASQVIEEKDEFSFGFDILDPTKLIPEELVPVKPLGTLTLNRNVDNYFAETEQVAFCLSHVVPGIDFTNDPLLQGRLFSYLDTQLRRVGPNFAQLPINRPLNPVSNNQREGFGRVTIERGKASYFPNNLPGPDGARGCPIQQPEAASAYRTFFERVDGHKIRARSSSFDDHFYPGDAVLEQHGRMGEGPYRRRLLLRIEPMRDPGDQGCGA